jgi:hypothetical protein
MPNSGAKRLMYEQQKMESYLRVNLLRPGPSSYKKIIYRAAVSQRLGNTELDGPGPYFSSPDPPWNPPIVPFNGIFRQG